MTDEQAIDAGVHVMAEEGGPTVCMYHLSKPSPAVSAPVGSDDQAMAFALAEAEQALTHGDVPVGAVVVVDGVVVAARHNERELYGDPTAHAELLALRDAAAATGGWRLPPSARLVVTLEPCPMCAGAALASRLDTLVFGATDPKAGACGTLYNLCSDPRLHHEITVRAGVEAEECGRLLTDFFSGLRAGGRRATSDIADRENPGFGSV